MTNELLKLQIRQLKRLVDLNVLTFEDAHCVIFSDYPNWNALILLLNFCEKENDSTMYNFIASKLNELVFK